MTYKINTTDGNLLVEIPDGTFDTSASSLTLIGKNVVNFGESLNENFIKLLENFASSSPPEEAIKGQLWYDTTIGRLNVYDGNTFRASGGAVLSPVQPTNLVQGDIWINTITNQFWFFDGTDFILVGPIYTSDQGRTGFYVETIVDTSNVDRVICQLFVNGTLLGIFSKDSFTPKFALTGYGPSGTPIISGFNASLELSNLKFNVTVSRAERLLLEDGVTTKTADEIAFITEENSFTEKVRILNNNPLILGGTEQIQQYLASDNFIVEHTVPDKDFIFKTKSGPIVKDALTIKGASERIGIFNNTPQYTLDVAGDLFVSGDLIVGGDNVTINTEVLEVEDKNIILGNTASPSDITADGGGIILKGASDKSIYFTNATQSWDFTEHINLPTGKSYKINGTTIITPTSLGSAIVSSSLTTLGNLLTLQMNAGLNITNSTITTASGNLILDPFGTIDAASNKITSVALPTSANDAANKQYVDNSIFSRPIAMSMDITGLEVAPGVDDNVAIAAILDDIAPFYDPISSPTGTAINGTILKLHCTKMSVSNGAITLNVADYNKTTVSVNKGAGVENQSVIQDFTLDPLTGPMATVTVSRQNKLFTMTSGNWVFTSDF